MNIKRSMSIVMLEDDEVALSAFESYAKDRNDVRLVAKTNSSKEAISLVQLHAPEAIIVDLELHNGSGSGFDFLREIRTIKLSPEPIIVVTTNIKSNNYYDKIHEGFADLIFYKKQLDYSPKLVVDALVFAKESLSKSKQNVTTGTILKDIDKRVADIINRELDLIGISYKLKGREYLFGGILYLLQEDAEKIKDCSVFQYLSKHYALLASSIGRAIQTAINEAWRTSSTEDLRINYTAKINYHTGVPTPTEFIFHYVQKIQKFI